MCCKTQHDEISVQTVKNVFHVRVISFHRSLSSNVIHDLVLTLTRYTSVREYNTYISPMITVRLSLSDVITKMFRKFRHERSPRRDDVVIPRFFLLFRNLRTRSEKFSSQIIFHLFVLFTFHCSFKTSASLLIHLCSRCATVDCHVNEFSRSSDVHQSVHVFKNKFHHLLLGFWFHGKIFTMTTIMYNTVHI